MNVLSDVAYVANGIYFPRMHLIGHSLGAHVAGYTRDNKKRAGRITGLDPAGPLFEGTDPKVRLDPTDADFVDVIHTDKTGFGIKQSTGHVDFYPNGGENQPGCKASVAEYFKKLIKGEINEIAKSINCSHMRATALFTESINTRCWFLSFPSENAVTCDTVCSVMGYDSPAGSPSGNLFLHTESSSPYCSEYLNKQY
ncbi:hypothetical protein ACJMK2_042287 [Sinanodonta woodiana]|uniref:Lipase domain-containing protein n=1 Tax=Sinanodonta woodiana TaxID=1069815 RepID=A0ABD3W6X1_SINWO